MAPINADVAEVEAQLSAIRSRRNGLVAQRALAGALSVALLAAALIVATALRARPALFAIAIAIAVLASAAAIAYAAWRTRGEWLSLPATAHLADAHAALEERITTLLAIARTNPRPPLSGLLINQVIGAQHRWGVESLAPQRFSPWLALVPLSLMIFAATAFYARPPAAAAARSARVQPPVIPARPVVGGSTEQPPPQDGLFAPGNDQLAMAGGARGETGAAGADGKDAGSSLAAQTAGTEASQMMPAAGGRAGAGELAPDDRVAKLRRSIREAFGAGVDDAGKEEGKARGRGGNADGERDAANRDGAAPRPEHDAAGVGAADGNRADNRSASTQSVTPNPARNTSDQGARGSGRGGAGSGGSTGVLGAAGSQRLQPDASAAVALKLKAISGVSPSQSEPQRRGEANTTAAAPAAKTGERPLPDLAGEQIADVTMQQPQIGPEHEAVVRRLFNRE